MVTLQSGVRRHHGGPYPIPAHIGPKCADAHGWCWRAEAKGGAEQQTTERTAFSSALDAGRSNQSKRRKRAELSPAEKDQATAQNTQSKRLNRADLSHTDTTTDNVPGDTVATATGSPRLIELQRKQYDPRCDGNEERQQEPQ